MKGILNTILHWIPKFQVTEINGFRYGVWTRSCEKGRLGYPCKGTWKEHNS